MFCSKCGEVIPEGSKICPKCGETVEAAANGEQAVIYASQSEFSQTPASGEKKKSRKGVVAIVIAIAAALAVIFFIVNSIQAFNLKKELLRDWMDISGEDGSYIIKVLDFSDDEVEYRLETGYSWLDSTLGTYDYKVVSGSKIKIKRFGDDYETFQIEFNDEKSMMIVTPAITSTDDSEHWFNLD